LKHGEEVILPEYGESRPARGAWIETIGVSLALRPISSRPARGAWIETWLRGLRWRRLSVAPRAGRVD